MAYKRPNGSKREKPTKLQEVFGQYQQIREDVDAEWIIPHLNELHEDGFFALESFSRVIDNVKKTDFKDYKDSVARQKKDETILQAKKALFSFLSKHMDRYKSEANKVTAAILRITAPEDYADPTKALLQEMKMQEIRGVIRSIEPRRRRDYIASNIDRIKACINAPDALIDAEALLNIRREFAFNEDSTLQNQERDAQIIAKAIRKRSAEINATASKILMNEKFNDPTPPSMHFEVFTPETEHEAAYAEKAIERARYDKDLIEKNRAFSEEDPLSVNFTRSSDDPLAAAKKIKIARGQLIRGAKAV